MTERVLERLPDLRLADDGDVLPLRPANFVSGLESMPMVFTPSRPAALSLSPSVHSVSTNVNANSRH